MIEVVKEFIVDYGIWSIFLIIMLEYACFPLPSEVLLPFVGVITATSPNITFQMVLTVSVCAGILGCYICYFIGYFGGRKCLDFIMRKFPSSRNGIEKSEEFILKYSSLAVGFGRVLPICRTYISFIAGMAKQDIAKFTFFSILGILVWNTLLIFCGYYLGDNWSSVLYYYDMYKMIILPLLLVVIVFMIFRKFIYKKRRNRSKK